ncbi:hypothetical protein KM043_001032 [Ampulex compressa]|nr:hypothetical protein KM043_001032 [Ampulex compressa]
MKEVDDIKHSPKPSHDHHPPNLSSKSNRTPNLSHQPRRPNLSHQPRRSTYKLYEPLKCQRPQRTSVCGVEALNSFALRTTEVQPGSELPRTCDPRGPFFVLLDVIVLDKPGAKGDQCGLWRRERAVCGRGGIGIIGDGFWCDLGIVDMVVWRLGLRISCFSSQWFFSPTFPGFSCQVSRGLEFFESSRRGERSPFFLLMEVILGGDDERILGDVPGGSIGLSSRNFGPSFYPEEGRNIEWTALRRPCG